jgi:predicted RNA binding protein YcfA (HicA-like mRNA interferase family)
MRGEAVQAAAGFSLIGVHILHIMTSAEVLRTLRAEGWSEVARKGSYVQLKHPNRKGRVTVPHPTKDLPVGTLKSIEHQAGIRLVTRK